MHITVMSMRLNPFSVNFMGVIQIYLLITLLVFVIIRN